MNLEVPVDVRTRTRVDATRARILSAARDLYARRGGSRGTTTREVAERAGVNEATVFRHFGTKQTLIRAMLDEYCGSSDLPAVIASLAGPIEVQLRVLGDAAIDALSRKQDLLKVGLAEEIVNPEASVQTWSAPSVALEALRSYFEGKIAEGILQGDPLVLARTFMSMYFAFVIGRSFWDRHPEHMRMSPEHVTAAFIDIFLNGARTQ